MPLVYNGVTLDPLVMNAIDRQTVTDPSGVDVIWTRWILDGVFTMNAGLIAGSRAGAPSTSPVGTTPFVTDNAIRELLKTNRAPLQFVMGGVVLVSVPQAIPGVPGGVYASDANNGPIVHKCEIFKIVGDNVTMAVHFVVECWVNECLNTTATAAQIIVSNRWSMRMVEDEDYYTAVETAGMVVARTDLLANTRNPLDALRSQFLMPQPTRLKREVCEVTALPDGNTCEYFLLDRELPLQLVTDMSQARIPGGKPSNATRCKVTHRQGLSAGDGAMDGVLNSIPSAILGKAFAGIGGGVVALGGAALGALLNSQSRYEESIHVWVAGHGGSNKARLYQMALSIAFGVSLYNNLGIAFSAVRVPRVLAVTFSRDRKEVEVFLRYRYSPTLTTVAAPARPGAPAGAGAGMLRMINGVPEDVVGGNWPNFIEVAAGPFGFAAPPPPPDNGVLALTDSPTFNFPGAPGTPTISPPPPGDAGTRGSYLKQLVTAALKSPCAPAPASAGPV